MVEEHGTRSGGLWLSVVLVAATIPSPGGWSRWRSYRNSTDAPFRPDQAAPGRYVHTLNFRTLLMSGIVQFRTGKVRESGQVIEVPSTPSVPFSEKKE